MNRAKIFIAFTFLLAFAVCVSAQEQMPKIVWKNLQEKYERFEDVKPVLANQSDKPIFVLLPTEFFSKLLIFDSKTNNWNQSSAFGYCGNIRVGKSNTKIAPSSELTLGYDWDWMFQGDQAMFDSYKTIPIYQGENKYKLQILYKNEKSSKEYLTSESPEFIVNINKETK